MVDKAARATFIEHVTLQDNSPAKSFSTSISLTTLNDLSIKDFSGSSADFIATWFEELCKLNELSSNTLSYDMTKGLLLKAIQGDTKLPDIFTDLNETGHKKSDLGTLKTTLLRKASLYDGKDRYLKQKGTATPTVAAHHTQLDPDLLRDDLSLLIQHATRTSNRDARLPDQLFQSLDLEDKQACRQLPESTRVKLVRLIQAKKSGSSERCIYFQDSGSTAGHSDITDDSHATGSL